MMAFIIDFLLEIIFAFSGPVMRWLFSGRRRSLTSFLEDDPHGNTGFALVVIGSLVLAVKYFPQW